ncbi:MAG: 6-hydroxymethylpterin diphosphokinase MptE-like protein [Pseudomonadota bacterium]
MLDYRARRLRALHNRHAGEQCVLVCNGPSLNQMNLSFLKHQNVIGLNKIYLGFKKFNFYPRYWVGVNPKVIQQSHKEIRSLNCVKFVSEHNSRGLVPEDALTYWVNTASPPQRFCKDLTLGVHEGWTVTFAALQVAYFLGFSRVIIIGMDHNFSYTGKPNEAHIMKGNDNNHFSPDYFGNGQQWDNPDVENSEASYRIAREVYEQDGRQILDASLDGHCEIFEKRDYRELFKGFIQSQ